MRKQKRYPRDESLYNLIQENEVMLFLRHLPLAAWWVTGNKSLWRRMGRPPKNLYDIIVCLAIRKYFNFSPRRGMGLLRLFKALGVIDAQIPCFKTLDNYQRSDETAPYLDEVLKLTTGPLGFLEHFFATDATGTATTCYSPWYDIRTRKEGRKRGHIMTHVTVGTELKAAVPFDARADHRGHSEILRKHVAEVAESFEVREWSGDRAYLSRENCNAVASVGAEPWFKLKSNTAAKSRVRQLGGGWCWSSSETQNSPSGSTTEDPRWSQRYRQKRESSGVLCGRRGMPPKKTRRHSAGSDTTSAFYAEPFTNLDSNHILQINPVMPKSPKTFYT